MGPYDIFAIKWGYQPIFEAKTPEAEKDILNKWILEKSDKLIYRYGDQQMGLAFDPSSQNEALGDDAIKASQYGTSNAKYIMEHLVVWTTEKNGDFEFLDHMYNELVKQYERYVGHVSSYLGGVYIYQMVEGEDKRFYNPVSKEKQKEALDWIFNELNTQAEWILNSEVERRLGTRKGDLFKSQSEMLDIIMSPVIFQRLELFHTEYSSIEYLDDIHNHIWEKTMKRAKLNDIDRNLQASYVDNLLSISGMKNISSESKPGLEPEEYLGSGNSSKTPFLDTMVKPLLYEKINETRKLLKKQFKVNDPVGRAHYKYLYEKLK